MESIDTDKNGKLNYTQFLAFAIEKDKLFKEENIKSVFKMLDKDGNGYVERSELEEVFKRNYVYKFRKWNEQHKWKVNRRSDFELRQGRKWHH